MQTEVYFCLRLIRIFDFVEDTSVRQCSNKFDIAPRLFSSLAAPEMLLLGKNTNCVCFLPRLSVSLPEHEPYDRHILSVGVSAGGVRKDAGYGGGRSPCRSRKSVVSAAGDHPAVKVIRCEMLERQRLEAWAGAYPPVRTPKRVLVVMAGNIPLVGFFDLLCVLASGHACRVKPSSKDTVLIGYVVDLLENDRSGYSSSGWQSRVSDRMQSSQPEATTRTAIFGCCSAAFRRCCAEAGSRSRSCRAGRRRRS